MNSSRLRYRLISLKIDILTTLFEPFGMFSLSTFQSKGHSQEMFYLRNIQKSVTVNSNMGGPIQKYYFRGSRFGISI